VATLIANGGSIKQKYALLWQQQMDRYELHSGGWMQL